MPKRIAVVFLLLVLFLLASTAQTLSETKEEMALLKKTYNVNSEMVNERDEETGCTPFTLCCGRRLSRWKCGSLPYKYRRGHQCEEFRR